MTIFKVALRASVRGISTHYEWSFARESKLKAGSEYHIYKWNKETKEWDKDD